MCARAVFVCYAHRHNATTLAKRSNTHSGVGATQSTSSPSARCAYAAIYVYDDATAAYYAIIFLFAHVFRQFTNARRSSMAVNCFYDTRTKQHASRNALADVRCSTDCWWYTRRQHPSMLRISPLSQASSSLRRG